MVLQSFVPMIIQTNTPISRILLLIGQRPVQMELLLQPRDVVAALAQVRNALFCVHTLEPAAAGWIAPSSVGIMSRPWRTVSGRGVCTKAYSKAYWGSPSRHTHSANAAAKVASIGHGNFAESAKVCISVHRSMIT